MRDISRKLKEIQLKNLKVQLGEYQRSLGETKDSKMRIGLRSLIRDTELEIKNLK